MKKIFTAALSLLLLTGAAGAGFFVGQRNARHESKRLVEGLSRNWLANDLAILRFFERGEIQEAKHLLQAGTSGYLSWIMEYDTTDYTPAETLDRCGLLNTLKQYRTKHQLFTAKEWEHLWDLPGWREEEAERQLYLDKLNCPDIFFFKVN
jgi:hypothetical protein